MPQASAAIAILKKLYARVGADHMPYWVIPNTVLTLAGARAYCDGVFWGKQQQVRAWQKEIDADISVLATLVDIYAHESKPHIVHGKENYASYDVVLRNGLDYILKETDLIELDPSRHTKGSVASLKADFVGALERSQGSTYTDDDLGHISFGVLVGYPDEAIIGLISQPEADADLYAEQAVAARIRCADYYDCPQPVYDYPRYLAEHPKILAHEQLWSTILEEFYTSDFHQELASNAAFQSKLSELNIRK